MKAYYEVQKPFRVFRHVGHADSNTWIGRSRAVNTVMEATLAVPGDVLHVLPGGTFLQSGTALGEVSLRRPKPVLEKSYGTPPSPLDPLVADGRLLGVPGPASPPDYAAAREGGREFPPCTEVVDVHPSPEMDDARTVAVDVARALGGPVGPFSFHDVDAHAGARFRLDHDGSVAEVTCNVGWTLAKVGDDFLQAKGPDHLAAAAAWVAERLAPSLAPAP